ncbi:MAG: flagellar motor protein MotB [Rhodospirillales bacterium]|nr:flagellar motor protein MotB [Rhodospirillales bacterium]MCB9965289.1 flagellar motor protein MotB [Rhodospirillales bacterium]MCB9972942.1 flagellar motor protein MotB [Rhodospirillales bacterium]MCB9980120.1 flagellar motor protein MotB [Rhodospirillales bacterium]
MRHNRRRRIEASGSSKSVQLLGLSLFIMLLAFFIVLNGLSSFDENKINPIMGSLENTFSTTLLSETFQKKPSVRPIDDAEGFLGEGEAIPTSVRIKNLFRGQIAGSEIRENREDGILLIDVPYVDFSTAILVMGLDSASAQGAEALPFLKTLVSLLLSEGSAEPYRMDVVLKVADDPVELKLKDPEAFRRIRDTVAKLSLRMEAAGIPPEQMSIGLAQGTEGMLELLFTPYEPIRILEKPQAPVAPSSSPSLPPSVEEVPGD